MQKVKIPEFTEQEPVRCDPKLAAVGGINQTCRRKTGLGSKLGTLFLFCSHRRYEANAENMLILEDDFELCQGFAHDKVCYFTG